MKENISLVLIFCMLLQLTCCFTPRLASKEELLASKEKPGLLIKTDKQFEYAFKKDSYTIDNDSIYGAGSLILENDAEVEQNVHRQISLNEIENFKIEKVDVVKTVMLSIVTVGLGVLLALGIKSVMEDATQNIAEGIGKGLQGVFK